LLSWRLNFLLRRIIAVTAIAATLLTRETLLAESSDISDFNDLAGKKVCAIHGTAPHTFIRENKKFSMEMINDIKNSTEMFWSCPPNAPILSPPSPSLKDARQPTPPLCVR